MGGKFQSLGLGAPGEKLQHDRLDSANLYQDSHVEGRTKRELWSMSIRYLINRAHSFLPQGGEILRLAVFPTCLPGPGSAHLTASLRGHSIARL